MRKLRRINQQNRISKQNSRNKTELHTNGERTSDCYLKLSSEVGNKQSRSTVSFGRDSRRVRRTASPGVIL